MLIGAVVLMVSGAVGGGAAVDATCQPPDPPEYYQINLVTTKRVPGSAYARGTAEMLFTPSPFGVSLGVDGSYQYELHISVRGLRPAPEGRYVAWVTTPTLEHTQRLGALDASFQVTGRVGWNKFIVAVSLEANDASGQERWQGPIVMRGMSRSGQMHTMAGHGPFEQENCAKYGY